MSSVSCVHIECVQRGKYSVKLVKTLTNDLGEMTETGLCAYLMTRLGLTPEQAEQQVSPIKIGDKLTLPFQGAL